MIRCTGCNISYSPGYAICPRCGTTTPFAPRRSYLETAAVRRVHASESPPLVVADLVVNSFSEVEAEEIVRVAVKQLRRENRRYGVLRSLVGTVMVVFGAVTTFFLSDTQGLLVFGSGLLACISGVVAIVTGRTPPLGPIAPDSNDDIRD